VQAAIFVVQAKGIVLRLSSGRAG